MSAIKNSICNNPWCIGNQRYWNLLKFWIFQPNVNMFWIFFFTYWYFFAIYSKCCHITSKLIDSIDCSHCLFFFSDGGSDSSVSDGPPVHLQFTASRVCSITINEHLMYSIISDWYLKSQYLQAKVKS